MIKLVRFPVSVEVIPNRPRCDWSVGCDIAAIEWSNTGGVAFILDGKARTVVIPPPGTIVFEITDEPAASPPASRAIPAEQRKTRR